MSSYVQPYIWLLMQVCCVNSHHRQSHESLLTQTCYVISHSAAVRIVRRRYKPALHIQATIVNTERAAGKICNANCCAREQGKVYGKGT